MCNFWHFAKYSVTRAKSNKKVFRTCSELNKWKCVYLWSTFASFCIFQDAWFLASLISESQNIIWRSDDVTNHRSVNWRWRRGGGAEIQVLKNQEVSLLKSSGWDYITIWRLAHPHTPHRWDIIRVTRKISLILCSVKYNFYSIFPNLYCKLKAYQMRGKIANKEDYLQCSISWGKKWKNNTLYSWTFS